MNGMIPFGTLTMVCCISSVCSISHKFSTEADYATFAWRQKSLDSQANPTLHLHDPSQPLPSPPDYMNSSYYVFKAPTSPPLGSPRPKSRARSVRSGKTRKGSRSPEVNDGIPQFKKDFAKFHNENGVRTVMGSIGPVQNGIRLFNSTVSC